MKTYLWLCIIFFISCRSFDPVSYEPPLKPERTGIYAVNESLRVSEVIAKGKLSGLESLDVDNAGNIYGGDKEGNVLKVTSSGEISILGNTGGRALGVQFDSKGNLIVADAYKGLLSLSKEGTLSDLTTSYQGEKFKFTDDMDIAKDGKIYFTDASIYEQKEYLLDLLESRPYGRLFVFDPKTKETKLLLDGLYFANGVALSKNEDFILINETYRYKISRYWLKGKKAGTKEDFIVNLPGFPDNITRNHKGEFWVALFTVRNDRMDKMHPSAFLKKLTSNLPKFLWPKAEPYGFVLKLDENGNVISTLQDPGGEVLKEITSAIEKDGYLYLGSLYSDRIGKLKLNDK
ncbi:SMP-30/gluconolactonase/LRE family protein [Leptospira idonii]|uniref:SMP-30/gluconolactonase/LRE family protein n=1 Tax=Leptospira idonii TaxID=1193500 RepID=A0A4R9M5G4_9LEPT|nr:SMP-30/gluconolactonase/LRE family protein [Leptospira idonii]TGN21055.1 SMP-30/gluconolactonase/LRE family protein [Leptospira idonii]